MSARLLIAFALLAASSAGSAAEPNDGAPSANSVRSMSQSELPTLTEDQRRGRGLFNESCVFCHGERGHATALLAKRLGADNAALERRTNLSPELIRHVVRRGINSMPWYPRAELSDRELDLITAYLTRSNAAK